MPDGQQKFKYTGFPEQWWKPTTPQGTGWLDIPYQWYKGLPLEPYEGAQLTPYAQQFAKRYTSAPSALTPYAQQIMATGKPYPRVPPVAVAPKRVRQPPQVISIGGRDFMVEIDENGQPIYTPLGLTQPTTGAPDWEQMRQIQAAQARWFTQMEAGAERRAQEGKEKAFEEVRQQVLGQLQQPRDWIAAWLKAQEVNPYAAAREREQEWAQGQERIAAGVPTYATTHAGAWEHTPEELVGGYISPETLEWTKLAEDVAYGVPGAAERAAEFTSRGTAPPTPSWLAGIYPELRTGQPLRKTAVSPIALGTWSAMPASQREAWRGYADWAGIIPEDIESQMQRMIPQTPWGAGQTRWTAPRVR